MCFLLVRAVKAEKIKGGYALPRTRPPHPDRGGGPRPRPAIRTPLGGPRHSIARPPPAPRGRRRRALSELVLRLLSTAPPCGVAGGRSRSQLVLFLRLPVVSVVVTPLSLPWGGIRNCLGWTIVPARRLVSSPRRPLPPAARICLCLPLGGGCLCRIPARALGWMGRGLAPGIVVL